jgi:hypothetical protein
LANGNSLSLRCAPCGCGVLECHSLICAAWCNIVLAYYESNCRSGVWTVRDVHLKPEYVKGLVFVQFTRLNLIIMWANNGDGQYHRQFVTDLRLGIADKNWMYYQHAVEIISSVISHLCMIVQTKQDWYYKSFVPFPKDSIVDKYIYTVVVGWISCHVSMSHY